MQPDQETKKQTKKREVHHEPQGHRAQPQRGKSRSQSGPPQYHPHLSKQHYQLHAERGSNDQRTAYVRDGKRKQWKPPLPQSTEP